MSLSPFTDRRITPLVFLLVVSMSVSPLFRHVVKGPRVCSRIAAEEKIDPPRLAGFYGDTEALTTLPDSPPVQACSSNDTPPSSADERVAIKVDRNADSIFRVHETTMHFPDIRSLDEHFGQGVSPPLYDSLFQLKTVVLLI